MNKLTSYLRKYYDIQKDILLCYRIANSGQGSSWSDRCNYREDNYSATKAYNHRMTLDKEVVIEFDEPNPEDNLKVAEEVIKRFRKDGINYSMWFSGSKSYHVHAFFDLKEARNTRLLKSVIMRYYCRELSFKPDLQMAGKHLIRAEYGINEKTGKYKERIRQSSGYPKINNIRNEVWDKYHKEMKWLMKASMSRTVNDLSESTHIKQLLDTTYFNDYLKDGRTRIIFVLANVLKGKYEKRQLVELLQKWYHYTSGSKLTDGQIAYQVYSAYKTDKSPGITYILQLIKEISDN